MTNQEKIQSMSEEELISLLIKLDDIGIVNYCYEAFCDQCEEYADDCDESCKNNSIDVIKWWLRNEKY